MWAPIGEDLFDELLFEFAHPAQDDLGDLFIGAQVVEDLETAQQPHLVGNDDVLDQRAGVACQHA
jgi:hypothetical protein